MLSDDAERPTGLGMMRPRDRTVRPAFSPARDQIVRGVASRASRDRVGQTTTVTLLTCVPLPTPRVSRNSTNRGSRGHVCAESHGLCCSCGHYFEQPHARVIPRQTLQIASRHRESASPYSRHSSASISDLRCAFRGLSSSLMSRSSMWPGIFSAVKRRSTMASNTFSGPCSPM
jgi:hypothetical protein